MPADATAAGPLLLQVTRFRSAAEALLRQDNCHGSPFNPARPALLAWTAPRALLAAPGESRHPKFEHAARACADLGWPVAQRRGGGRVCPVAPGTLQLAINRPASAGVTIDSAYEEMAGLIDTMLARFGVTAERGTCDDAFCPGRYDLAVDGRKIAGIAQTWRLHRGERIAITGASLIVGETPEELAEAVNLFCRQLGDPPACRADAIGSLSRTLGRPVTVADILGTLPGPPAGKPDKPF